VTIIEAAAIFAVVRGLTDDIVIKRPRDIFAATNMPLDPPKPLPPPVEHKTVTKPHDTTDRVPQVLINLGSGPIAPYVPPIADPEPGPLAGLIIDPPKAPQFTPRSAKPLGRPSSWATSNDYPARDLREGNAGVTGFRLSIGADGKVINCAITAPSGFAGLDRATCENIVRRARFEPATDGSGARVAGTYSNNIRWVIPE
jgi:periplasmic protein TonB